MTSKKTTNNTSIPTSLDGTAAAPAKAPKGRAPRTSTTAVTHKHKKAVSATEDAVAPPTVPAVETPLPSAYPTREEIAIRAYLYAESRGFQGGSPEEDWLHAEQALLAERDLA